MNDRMAEYVCVLEPVCERAQVVRAHLCVGLVREGDGFNDLDDELESCDVRLYHCFSSRHRDDAINHGSL